jgi:hypothetical protein
MPILFGLMFFDFELLAALDLPSHIKQLQDEVEKLAGAPVRLIHDKTIDGEMSNEIEGEIPTIRYRDNFDDEGIAHELLHLKIEYNGYKRLSFPIGSNSIKWAAVILQNVVQHQMIFPHLETWGYCPKAIESGATQKVLDKMLDEIEKDYSRLNDDQYFCSLFAMVYVKGKLDCNNEKLNETINRVFSNSLLYQVKQMGEAVVKMIREFPINSVTEYNKILNQCLCLLNLNDIVEVN